jgi:hypothetical protein
MSCKPNAGLLKDCGFLIAGMDKFYLASIDDVVSFNDTNNDDIFEGLTMSGTASVFYQFDVSVNTSSITEVYTPSPSGGFIQQTADILIPRADSEARLQLELLVKSDLIVLGKNRMGKLIVLGVNADGTPGNGLKATVGNLNSGVAEADNAGIQLTITAPQLNFGREYTGTIPL